MAPCQVDRSGQPLSPTNRVIAALALANRLVAAALGLLLVGLIAAVRQGWLDPAMPGVATCTQVVFYVFLGVVGLALGTGLLAQFEF